MLCSEVTLLFARLVSIVRVLKALTQIASGTLQYYQHISSCAANILSNWKLQQVIWTLKKSICLYAHSYKDKNKKSSHAQYYNIRE